MKYSEHRKQHSALSDMPLRSKLLTVLAAECLVLLLTIGSTSMLVRSVRQHITESLENTTIRSAESLMEMTIENTVSAAKMIYTDTALYTFLDTEYPSAAAYYEAYYNLEQSSLLAPANMNTIQNYVIYTENPTIMSGNGIRRIRKASSEDWYAAFQRLNKPMILWCAPETGTLSIIRRLDYQTMTSGEAILKLDMNLNLFQNYCKALEFDGELYILSGSAAFYNGGEELTDEQSRITQDFSSYTKNYYTADIDYYAKANPIPATVILSACKWMLLSLTAAFLLMQVLLFRITGNLRKRLLSAAEVYRQDGTFLSLRETEPGKDEVGTLLSDSAALSERLLHKTTQCETTKEKLLLHVAECHELYAKALFLDVQGALWRKEEPSAFRPLAEEIRQVQQLAEQFPDVRTEIQQMAALSVPTGTLVSIMRQFFPHGGVLIVKIADETTAVLTWESTFFPDTAHQLRMLAIFEESEVSTAYPFRAGEWYNPYLLLVHGLGKRTAINLKKTEENTFQIQLVIKS